MPGGGAVQFRFISLSVISAQHKKCFVSSQAVYQGIWGSNYEEEIVLENTQGKQKYPDESSQSSQEAPQEDEQENDAIAPRTRSSRTKKL